jgi:hypothetical protein
VQFEILMHYSSILGDANNNLIDGSNMDVRQ